MTNGATPRHPPPAVWVQSPAQYIQLDELPAVTLLLRDVFRSCERASLDTFRVATNRSRALVIHLENHLRAAAPSAGRKEHRSTRDTEVEQSRGQTDEALLLKPILWTIVQIVVPRTT
jgi:hypothetical protein